jgi:hypothetical protein
MFESYRARHRINNLQLDFLSGGVEVGGRLGGSPFAYVPATY